MFSKPVTKEQLYAAKQTEQAAKEAHYKIACTPEPTAASSVVEKSIAYLESRRDWYKVEKEYGKLWKKYMKQNGLI